MVTRAPGNPSLINLSIVAASSAIRVPKAPSSRRVKSLTDMALPPASVNAPVPAFPQKGQGYRPFTPRPRRAPRLVPRIHVTGADFLHRRRRPQEFEECRIRPLVLTRQADAALELEVVLHRGGEGEDLHARHGTQLRDELDRHVGLALRHRRRSGR